jgi:hypothetical protein
MRRAFHCKVYGHGAADVSRYLSGHEWERIEAEQIDPLRRAAPGGSEMAAPANPPWLGPFHIIREVTWSDRQAAADNTRSGSAKYPELPPFYFFLPLLLRAA